MAVKETIKKRRRCRCGALVSVEYLSDDGLCESCVLQDELPLFEEAS